MQIKGEEGNITVSTDTESVALPAIIILEDLQKQLLNAGKEEQLIREKHRTELAPFIARKALITTAIDNLLAIYPDQKENAQKVLTKAVINLTEINTEIQRDTESTHEKGSKGSKGINGRRPAGLVKGIIIEAIRKLDSPVKAETVVEYISKTSPELGLSGINIYTGLKDCRKRDQIKVIKTYRYNTLTQINCLPNFFIDAENLTELKPEYEAKLNRLMFEDNLKWEQEY